MVTQVSWCTLNLALISESEREITAALGLTWSPGYSRRPRPTPRTLLQTDRLHLHRFTKRLRAGLHPPHSRVRRHPCSIRLPQHPPSQTTLEGRHGRRIRLCGKSHAEVQAERQCLQSHHHGHAAGGAGSFLQRRSEWE